MPPSDSEIRRPRILIVGAGPGGLCMGIRLREAGFDDFTILEKGSGVGGTWYHNRYPGCAVDVPSFLYSFSFAKKTDWSRPYATQPELLDYMEGLAKDHGLLPHCRFGQEVRTATWDEGEARWRVETACGDHFEAEIVVSALGMFNEVALPEIPGRDAFQGPAFHSARWEWEHPLADQRIGVIGSAASAVQILPELARTAKRVDLYQRTANWIVPKEDVPYTPEQLAEFEADPSILDQRRADYFKVVDEGMTFDNPDLMRELEGISDQCRAVIEDPEVREKLAPDHPYGCKRPLVSNAFYPTFNRDNVELVTDPIERVTATGIRTRDGREREIDLLVFATGFRATEYLSALDVRGRGGVSIDDAWADGAHAYLGMATAGFPNLFMLYGPNTNNGSILEMLESQTAHVLRQVERFRDEQLRWIDVDPDVQSTYNEQVQKAIADIPVWNHPVNGYYRSASGRVVTQWPFSMTRFREWSERVAPDDYRTG